MYIKDHSYWDPIEFVISDFEMSKVNEIELTVYNEGSVVEYAVYIVFTIHLPHCLCLMLYRCR